MIMLSSKDGLFDKARGRIVGSEQYLTKPFTRDELLGAIPTRSTERSLLPMSTVLIIDDSPTELHLFQNMLERNGFETLVADSGEEGLKQAKLSRPHCILMDVVMPGMNGFQATRKLSKDPDTSNIPVIIITTKDQETDKIWGMRQGAVEYLVKPIVEKQLVEMINSVMDA